MVCIGLLLPALVCRAANGITNIWAETDSIVINGSVLNAGVEIIEIGAFETITNAKAREPLARTDGKTTFTLRVPRFTTSYDRAYSSFVAINGNDQRVLGTNRFIEEFRGISRNTEAFPSPASKKGLQVQMIDDAITLDIKHAALNVNITSLIELTNRAGALPWEGSAGEPFYFNTSRIESLDRQVKKLSDAGIVVSLIILAYESSRADVTKLMLHPKYDPKAPNHLGAFNTGTKQGVRYLSACMEFLAERYSRADHRYGRAVNFIIGNEINSHWFWYNMGRVSMEELADQYSRAVRICHTAARKYSANARVYLSLEHHWNIRYPGGDRFQAFPGRQLIDYFNACAKAQGDFDWHLAFHPYPENLFESRTWNDKTATFRDDTPRITFKNIEMLTDYLQHPEMIYRGKPRRVILSEQGFHSPDRTDGELLQAAAYAYAWYRTINLSGIDSFILHRHVDHPAEGGLNLGLWRRNQQKAGSTEPVAKKQIYEVFRQADTADWQKAFAFALPVIGIKSWDEIKPRIPSR